MATAPQTKIILTVSMIVLAACLLIFFGVMPQLRQVAATRAQITGSQSEQAAVLAKVQSFETARAELRKLETGKRDISFLFPARDQMELAVQGLENAAAESGAEMTLQITDAAEAPKAAVKGDDQKPKIVVEGLASVEEVPFEAQLTGTYRQILDFFQYFDHTPYVTRITVMEASAETKQGEKDLVSRNTGRAIAHLKGVFFMRISNAKN